MTGSPAFDLIVAESGGVCFLELNQAGNFLVAEDLSPELEVLDRFCRFLAGGRAGQAFGSLGEFRKAHGDVDWSYRVQNDAGEFVPPSTARE